MNLREDPVTARINEWIGSLFVPQNRDATVRALVASQGDPRAMARGDAARQQLAEAEATLRRFQEAIAAGVDPTAVIGPINRARAERDVAKACLAHPGQQPEMYTEAEVRATRAAFCQVYLGRRRLTLLEVGRPDTWLVQP